LRGHLKCKGQNNEDKGYLKSTRDTKKDHPKKKKKLPLEPLGKKSSKKTPPPQKKKKKKKKPQKKGGKTSLHFKNPKIKGKLIITTGQKP